MPEHAFSDVIDSLKDQFEKLRVADDEKIVVRSKSDNQKCFIRKDVKVKDLIQDYGNQYDIFVKPANNEEIVPPQENKDHQEEKV